MKRRSKFGRFAHGAVALAAAFALFQPATVSAKSTGPIHISSCDVKKIYSQTGVNGFSVNGKGYNFFNITFTNTAKVTASKIVFQIEFETSRYVVGDAGSFAPGNQVTHHLRDHGTDVQPFERAGGSGPTVCSVLAVTFSDGTSWKPPVAAVPSPSPMST
jgi:hypothetical protein